MIRTIFSVMAGMLVAMMLMLGLEFAGSWLFPMPGGQLTSEADLAEIVANASTGKLAWVLLGWLVAAFAGGWTAARLARLRRVGAAVAVGVLIVLGVLLNAWLLPHPLWMSLAGVLLPVPLAWAGGRVVARRAAGL